VIWQAPRRYRYPLSSGSNQNLVSWLRICRLLQRLKRRSKPLGSNSSTKTAVVPEYGYESGRKGKASPDTEVSHEAWLRVRPDPLYFGKTNPKYWQYFKVLTIQKFEIFAALPEFFRPAD
jgi:hypothetical protein